MNEGFVADGEEMARVIKEFVLFFSSFPQPFPIHAPPTFPPAAR